MQLQMILSTSFLSHSSLSYPTNLRHHYPFWFIIEILLFVYLFIFINKLLKLYS